MYDEDSEDEIICDLPVRRTDGLNVLSHPPTYDCHQSVAYDMPNHDGNAGQNVNRRKHPYSSTNRNDPAANQVTNAGAQQRSNYLADDDLLVTRSDLNDAIRSANMSTDRMKPKIPTFPAPRFSGASDENFHQWLRDFETYANVMLWNDVTKSAMISMMLDKRAKQVFQSFPTAVSSSWDLIVQNMESHFGENETTRMLKYHRLDRLQKRGESVRDYALDLCARMDVAGVTDEAQRLSTFYRGLLPAIKSQVIMSRPRTLSECESLAEIAENNIQVNGSATDQAVRDAVNEVGVALKEQIKDISPRPATPPTKRRVSFGNTGNHHDRQVPQNQKFQHYQNYEGQKARNEGHYNFYRYDQRPTYQRFSGRNGNRDFPARQMYESPRPRYHQQNERLPYGRQSQHMNTYGSGRESYRQNSEVSGANSPYSQNRQDSRYSDSSMSACFRCGRTNHSIRNCKAIYHTDGTRLVNYRRNDHF